MTDTEYNLQHWGIEDKTRQTRQNQLITEHRRGRQEAKTTKRTTEQPMKIEIGAKTTKRKQFC
jgi:hypothetical protein